MRPSFPSAPRHAVLLSLLLASASPILGQTVMQPSGQPLLYQGVPPINPDDPVDALGRYLRILAANPRDLAALTGAGRAALAVGDPAAALGFYARADEVSPRNPRIKAGLGTSLVQMEQPREALRLFAQAIELGLPEADIAGDRGLAYDLRGEGRRAQADYTLALRARDDPEILRRLALSMAISGDRYGALTMIGSQIRSGDPAGLRTRAFILALSGDATAAAAAVRQALPAAQAEAMTPFLARMAGLREEEKAAAVHFGRFPSDGRRYSQSELFADAARGPDSAPPPVRPSVRADAPLIPWGTPLGTPAATAPAPLAEATTERARGSRAPRRRPGQTMTGGVDSMLARRAAVAPATPAAPIADGRLALAAPQPTPTPPPATPSRSGGQQLPVQPTIGRVSGFPGPRATPAQAPTRSASVAPAEPATPTPAAAAASRPVPPVPVPPVPVPPVPAPAVPTPPPGQASVAVPSPPATSPLPQQAVAPSPSPTPAAVAGASVTPPPVASIVPATERPMVPAPVEASVVPPPTADAAASATPSAPQAVSPSPPAASPTPVEATRTALVGPPNEPERSPARAAGALPPPTRPAAAAPQPAAGAPTSVSPGVTTAATPSRATVAARPPAPAPRARTETPAARAEAAAGRADPARGRTASSRDRSATRDRTTDAASSTTRERAAAVTREPARPAAPERYWVQVASGANKANLGRAWEGIVAKAPALLRGRPTWTTPWRASNRLLVGPFPSEEAAQAFVNRLGGAGVSGIQFTSRAGVAVERLATR